MGPSTGPRECYQTRHPLPSSRLGPHPSQSLSPFQLAPGTRALDTHKGAREPASSGSSSGWAEKAGRGLEPESSWEGTGLGKGEKGWEEPAKGFGFTRGSCLLAASSPRDQPDVNSGERKPQPSHFRSEPQLLWPQSPLQPRATAVVSSRAWDLGLWHLKPDDLGSSPALEPCDLNKLLRPPPTATSFVHVRTVIAAPERLCKDTDETR